MPLHARRALTPEEITLGASIFAAEIDWPRVRLVQAPPLPFGAMAPFRHTIIFARWRAPTDFAAAPLAEQGWLIHELAHVWQAARGYVLPIAKLGALGRRAYRLGAAPRSRFHAHNIEQQAEIARFVFLARAGLETPWPREVLEAVWADRL